MTELTIRGLLTETYNAAAYSPDLSTQNGAILVNPDYEILVAGFNHIPDGLEVTTERLHRPLKYAYTEHAERAVIYIAARQGIKTDGTIMFCNWAACEDCARAIIMSGISKLVTHGIPVNMSRPEWKERVDRAATMLAEAGVAYEIYDSKLGLKEPVRFDGELIYV